MNADRRKYVGREFLQRFCAASEERDNFEVALDEFRHSALEMRKDVASGLLSIATDRSENAFQRGFALCALAVMIRTCELVGDEEVEEQLDSLVDRPGFERSAEGLSTDDAAAWQIRYRALMAMIGVNRRSGLQKLDHLLGIYGDSEHGQQLRELRDRFSNDSGGKGGSER